MKIKVSSIVTHPIDIRFDIPIHDKTPTTPDTTIKKEGPKPLWFIVPFRMFFNV